MDMEQHRRLWRLIDKKDEVIEKWARNMATHVPQLAEYNLTAYQRRLIAALMYAREVSILSEGHVEQPRPIAGVDANRRIVVQRIERGMVHMYAITREGAPHDIKAPVISLKTGKRVPIPPHIRVIESD